MKARYFVAFFLALFSHCSLFSAQVGASPDGGIYRFWVLIYQPPVQTTSWVPSSKLAADPEGAALNIAKAMQRGDVKEWLANWNHDDRPRLSGKERQALVQQWQKYRDRRIEVFGRIVDGFNVIVELSFIGPQDQKEKLQFPLIKSEGRWWLTALDPATESLHWATSTNRLTQYIDPDAFRKRIEAIEASPK